MNTTFLKLILVSLLTFIVYGFIDSLFFGIYLNDGLAKYFEKIGLNKNNSDVIVGALSSSTAIIISSYIEKINKKIFGELVKNPLLDVAGVIVGSYLYIVTIKNIIF